jgi:bifunctional ADP-heptose synthase (sugar kinase/adenylyltransferase)
MSALADRFPDESGMATIPDDTLPYGYISSLHHRFQNKIFNPAEDPTALDRLLELRQKWAQGDAVTVFTSGVYDLLHLDHAAYLLHTKAVGAAVLYERSGNAKPLEALDSTEQQEYTTRALGDKLLRLIVSVDGDNSVAIRKGFRADKGSTSRPIYGWGTRALMVASQAFVHPYDKDAELLIPTVDAVTIHGPDDFPDDHNHATHTQLVEALQPDVWAIFGESQDILEEAPTRPGLRDVALRRIMDGEGSHYFTDTFMGKISTTKILERARGK